MSDPKEPIDVRKLRRESQITLKDGRKAEVKNVYMGTNGIMVVAKTGIAGPCDQNFLLDDIVDVKAKGE